MDGRLKNRAYGWEGKGREVSMYFGGIAKVGGLPLRSWFGIGFGCLLSSAAAAGKMLAIERHCMLEMLGLNRGRVALHRIESYDGRGEKQKAHGACVALCVGLSIASEPRYRLQSTGKLMCVLSSSSNNSNIKPATCPKPTHSCWCVCIHENHGQIISKVERMYNGKFVPVRFVANINAASGRQPVPTATTRACPRKKSPVNSRPHSDHN